MSTRWHVFVNGEPACSHRALLDDRRLPYASGFCSSYDRTRIEQLAAEVRSLYPQWTVEVRQDACHEGVF